MALTRMAVLAGLLLTSAYGQTTCASFPAGFIPFTSITYVTAANFNGDHLVVGVPAPGALNYISANIPLPTFTNQTFCGQVQLAPQQFYPNVYVPTAAELSGNFSAFSGLLTDPATNLPFAGGVIPPSQLNSIFAWRIGTVQTSGNQNWTATGSMSEPQSQQAAVMLPSGQVLILSGVDNQAYLYNPLTGTFAATGSMLVNQGFDLTATLLSNGQVLVVGGRNSPGVAELYNPASGKFSLTGAPVYPHGFYGTSTSLNDGRVLVVGGIAGQGGIGTIDAGAETYNPATGTFTAAGPMNTNRANHTATLLADGRVLIAGGSPPPPAGGGGVPAYNTAEIFDPKTNSFTQAGTMQEPRGNFMSALLPNGQVLLAGGYGENAPQSAELFNPATGDFTQTGEMNSQRGLGTATLLPSGQVLLAGGFLNTSISTSTTEVYNPATGTFSETGNMTAPRANHTATLLLNGTVLVTGGAINNFAGNTFLASAEIFTPTTQGLVTSQTGLTFRIAQANTSLATQSVEVLSTTTTIPWTLSVHTYAGGNWLTAAPSGGNAVPGATPSTLVISVNPAGLAAQTYYGAVTLSPTDGVHPPVSIAIVLNIVPAGTSTPPVVSPAGLLFTSPPAAAGATITLNPQNFNVTNLTSSPVTFTATGSNTPKFFSFTPASGTINAASTVTFSVTPNVSGIAPGVYTGTIQITFGDGSTQTVSLLLVVSVTATAHARPRTTAPATCTPNALLPVFTSLGTGFSAPAAWPVTLGVSMVDNCANQINSGNVIVSFTDGDPPVSLLSTGSGNWTGTWVPVTTSTGVSLRADAQSGALTGSVSVSGQASSNPAVPVVSAGGVVGSIDFQSAPSLGALVSIFGSSLATGAVSASSPRPAQLGATQVVLGGQALPLLYVSPGLINVLIPYDLAVNVSDQLVVENAGAYSVPVSTAIFNATPAIVSLDGSGAGQGQIYAIGAGGVETLADQNNPATAGTPVVIYCVGLGAVNPTTTAGDPAPVQPLAQAVGTVTVTFGTVTAPAAFAGLTPGETGLYQINTTIPAGVPTGNQVPVTISAGGPSSSAAVYMAIR